MSWRKIASLRCHRVCCQSIKINQSINSDMDPSAVRIVASEMNIMKEELIDFIKKSDKEGKTITKEQIHAFFEKLTENKNKRLRPDDAPHTA